MTRFKKLDDLPDDLTGKKVLVRVDLNVPMDGAKVTDDTRLRAMLPTVLELSDRGAIVLLLSHFGRPKGEIRPDMSTSEPDGTWQYPPSVCRPRGARVGSTTPGWAMRQYGRSWCRPACTSDSLRATSASVPPRCTVPASRQDAASHGTGPDSAQSTLQTPSP